MVAGASWVAVTGRRNETQVQMGRMEVSHSHELNGSFPKPGQNGPLALLQPGQYWTRLPLYHVAN